MIVNLKQDCMLFCLFAWKLSLQGILVIEIYPNGCKGFMPLCLNGAQLLLLVYQHYFTSEIMIVHT